MKSSRKAIKSSTVFVEGEEEGALYSDEDWQKD